MFVGHLALALAAKRKAPQLSLGWLMAGTMALDLLWPIFSLAGLEHTRIVSRATAFNPLVFESYPWSHSLLMAVVWGTLLVGLGRILHRPVDPAWLLFALVVSHWLLDCIAHGPDMPLWPGPSPRLGLGLWNSIPATLIVEGALWVAGIALYHRARRATSWRGPVALWSLIAIGTVMWAAGPWSAPPPGARALAWFSLIGWIILPWAAVADRHYGTAP